MVSYVCISFHLSFNEQSNAEDTTYITLSNTTRYTTCKMREDSTSCYAVIMFNDNITAAFVSKEY